MALIRTFYTRDNGSGHAESYSLARDVTTDRVFILHTQTFETAQGVPDMESKLLVGTFLDRTGPAQQELLQLIGSLVPEI